MKRGWLIGMMCLVGVLGVCGGCIGLGGETPPAEPSAVVATATATVTATPWPPTATVAPTVTPTAPPRWGAMWAEEDCNQKVAALPRLIREGEAGAKEGAWYGMLGNPLRPLEVKHGLWLPLIFDPAGYRLLESDWRVPEVKTEEIGNELGGMWLAPTPWGALGDKPESIWTEKRMLHPRYWVVVYDWEEGALHCVRWRGGEEGEDLGPMQLLTSPWGVVLWDPKGGKMYGLEGRELRVGWEAPYESAAWKVDEKGRYPDVATWESWTGKMWGVLVMDDREGEEEWTVEGYEVRTGRHWYIRLAPQPGPWGAGWELKDVKYTWDQGKMALLQVKEGWPTQYRVLVYDLGACEEAGEAPCRPQAYDLAQIQKNWSAVCRHVAKMFWDPDGERLYLVSASSVEPGCDWQKAPSAIWELRAGEGEWHPIRLELTERALEEVRRLSGRDELGYSYLGPVAWDVGGGKRLLLHIVLPGYGSMYGWLKVEGEEEGVLDLMDWDEVPFGLVLPER